MMYAPLVERMPKAKPLAQALIETAAAQGVNEEELSLACELAKDAYRLARTSFSLSELEKTATQKLDGLCMGLRERVTSGEGL